MKRREFLADGSEPWALRPCWICGALPEVDPGMVGIPESGGFVSCLTVHEVPGFGTVSCPSCAESHAVWNHMAEIAGNERERLRKLLQSIELLTATGDGLEPDATIQVHLLAGRHAQKVVE